MAATTIKAPQAAPARSVSFTLPEHLGVQVESVHVEIDNTAGPDVTPTLQVQDASAATVARAEQDAAIPGGDTGSATFALRAGDSRGGIRYGRHNSGTWLDVATTTVDGFTGDTGAGKAVTFDMPNNANGGSLVVRNGTGDTVFDAGGDSAGNYGIDLRAGGLGSLNISAPFTFWDNGGGIVRILNVSLFDVAADTFQVICTSDWVVQTAHASVGVAASEEVQIGLANGQPLTVFDHLGNPIFRVDEDGDLHGLTGKALVFDL